MPEQKEFYFPSSTGKNQIYVRMWIPDAGTDIKATVQLSHGIAEGIDRYDDFAQFLARNGYVVVGNDHLGHAKSVQDPKDKGFFAEENGWAYVVELISSNIPMTLMLASSAVPATSRNSWLEPVLPLPRIWSTDWDPEATVRPSTTCPWADTIKDSDRRTAPALG